MENTPAWPENKRFAFTICDDTDHATVQRVKPIYDLLGDLGLWCTKTLWVYPTDPNEHYESAQTLEDETYRQFILDLQSKGFEIALHCVRGCSSQRKIIQAGIERFREVLGDYPSVHINHAQNLDNLYWGRARLSRFRRRLRLYRGQPSDSLGHDNNSPYFWGDLAQSKIRYVRDMVFSQLNTLKCDPYMPYTDPQRPFVRSWFSSSDGGNAAKFIELLNEENQQRLEQEGGLAIVYTHFGTNQFVNSSGQVNKEVAQCLTSLSKRKGWFRPVSQILDHISGGKITKLNWRRRAVLLANKWMR